MYKSNGSSRKNLRVATAPLLAAVALAAALPGAAHAASVDSVGASATFTAGALTVKAPTSAVSFGSTQLDGRASYDLAGDIGDWGVNDASGAQAGWNIAVSASDPKAADNGAPATDAVMTMKTPTAQGVGPTPTVSAGDASGFVRLNTSGGASVVSAAAGKGIGQWQMLQAGVNDLKLVMPYNTRPVQYDSTITFTTGPAL